MAPGIFLFIVVYPFDLTFLSLVDFMTVSNYGSNGPFFHRHRVFLFATALEGRRSSIRSDIRWR